MLDKVLTGKLTFKSLKPCDLSNTNKQEIQEYFENTYDLNESVFTALKDDSVFYKCPDKLRLPLIFYYAHTACVYVNKLILADLLKPEDRVNLSYETMFETGVDEMSWDDTENYRMGGKIRWPSVDEVVEYRRVVRNKIIGLIQELPITLPITMDTPLWALFMGMEHERIHLETSSVLIRQLPKELVEKPPGYVYGPIKGSSPVLNNPLIKTNKCKVTLGKPKDFPSYGWDNEYGQVVHEVPEVEISKYPITNREFLSFVEAGGYEKRDYWTEEGWQWKEYRKAHHPTFWVCNKGCPAGCGGDLSGHSHCKDSQQYKSPLIERQAENHMTNGQNSYCNGHSTVDDNGHQGSDEGGGHKYRLRCIFDEINLPLDWPVETNYHEAKAFCTWKGQGYRLLAEAEHHVIRGPMKSPEEGTICDIIYQPEIKANLNFKYGSSTPVNLFPPNDLGFCDPFGNVWEWVEDHFNGLPGFQTSALYDDFSSPCFDGRHTGILGGSWISTGDEASRFARYAFRRHFFQHCGFRVARDISINSQSNDLKTPVRLVNTTVYVQRMGVLENKLSLPGDVKPELVPSSYVHYVQDTEEIVQQQLVEEYGNGSLQPVAHKIDELLKKHKVDRTRAMHLGCTLGSVSFSLGRHFDEILALDFSARFIDVCQKLQEGNPVSFLYDGQKMEAAKPEKLPKDNINFKQLNWLPNEVGFCNFMLASFFDRVQNASAWISRLREIILNEGLLIIASNNSWTEATLKPLIGKYFTLIDSVDVPSGVSMTTRLTVWRHQ